MKIALTILCTFFSLSVFAATSPPTMAHLKFKDGAIHAHCMWKQGPQTPDESILEISWMNGTHHTPMELPGTFTVTLLMPSMPEMPNPPTQVAPVLDSKGHAQLGVYRVSDINLSMDGDWDVRVNVTYTDGTKETQAIKVHLDAQN